MDEDDQQHEELTLRCSDCRSARVLKAEFSKKNLWMTGDTSLGRVNWVRAFGASRFKWLTGFPLLLWRFALACFGVGVLIWSIVHEEVDGDAFSFGYWMYTLTHWMVVVNALCVVSLFICTCTTQLKYKETSDIWKTTDLPHIARIAWVTKIISLSGSMFVVLLFWLLLKETAHPLAILSHGGLWAAIVFDHLFIGMQPYLLVQYVWVLVFGICYGFWTLIFHWANLTNKEGNPWIYAPIKWKTAPGTAAFWAFGSLVVILLPLYILFWLLNFCRKQAIYRVSEGSGTSKIVSGGGPITQQI